MQRDLNQRLENFEANLQTVVQEIPKATALRVEGSNDLVLLQLRENVKFSNLILNRGHIKKILTRFLWYGS